MACKSWSLFSQALCLAVILIVQCVLAMPSKTSSPNNLIGKRQIEASQASQTAQTSAISSGVLGAIPRRYPCPWDPDLILIRRNIYNDMEQDDWDRLADWVGRVVGGAPPEANIWDRNHNTIVTYEEIYRPRASMRFITNNEADARKLIYKDMDVVNTGLDSLWRAAAVKPKYSEWQVWKASEQRTICTVKIGPSTVTQIVAVA